MHCDLIYILYFESSIIEDYVDLSSPGTETQDLSGSYSPLGEWLTLCSCMNKNAALVNFDIFSFHHLTHFDDEQTQHTAWIWVVVREAHCPDMGGS